MVTGASAVAEGDYQAGRHSEYGSGAGTQGGTEQIRAGQHL
jgi:hypothetical protein